jgi:hypothetical protein
MYNVDLMRAENAVKYVETKVKYGAPNRSEDVLHVEQRYFALDWPSSAPRDQSQMLGILHGRLPEIMTLMDGPVANSAARMRTLSQLTQRGGVGTCIGLSAVAFEYLMDRHVMGMAVIGLERCDHAFVVLGLRQMPPVFESFESKGAPPASWGLDAIVCDPWYHEWFIVGHDWNRKLQQILMRTAPAIANAESQVVRARCIAYV